MTYVLLLILISVLINWNLSPPPIFGVVRVARSLVFCVCFVDPYFVVYSLYSKKTITKNL